MRLSQNGAFNRGVLVGRVTPPEPFDENRYKIPHLTSKASFQREQVRNCPLPHSRPFRRPHKVRSDVNLCRSNSPASPTSIYCTAHYAHRCPARRINMASQDDISFLPLGANLHTFTVSGLPLVISLPDQPAYTATGNPAYFGETIGRLANRIKDGRLHLNGTEYNLTKNNGPNTLHGGPKGWGKQLWSGPHPENRDGKESVRFELTSPDGDEGFPATVVAKTWYTAFKDDSGATNLEVEYEVHFPTDGPKVGKKGEQLDETIVNVTNHTAFSIAPDAPKGQSRNIAGTRVKLFTDKYQVVNSALTPTGEIGTHPIAKAGQEVELGSSSPKFDECFVLSDVDPSTVPLDTRQGQLRKLVAFSHPETKMNFEAWSTEPAFQFYTGEYIDLSYEGHVYKPHSGFCVEASRYIDAANNEKWKGQVLLKRGETWGSKTVYKAWKA